MNKEFELLLIELEGVTRRELLQALYVIRAPKNLVAIISMCREFQRAREAFSELEKAPSFGLNEQDYAYSLRVLDQIAELDIDDDYFSGRCLQNRKNQWTPMRPFTGDSVIAELLLVTTNVRENKQAFEKVSAWLIKQVQYFHFQRLSLDVYEQYMLGEGSRLLDTHYGRRPYGSLLALQKIDRDTERLILLSQACRFLSENKSFKYALLAAFAGASSKTERNRLKQHALRHFDILEDELLQQSEDVARILPREWVLLLFSVWETRLSLIRRPGGGGGSASPRRVERNGLIYGSVLTETFIRVGEEGETHAGVVADFYERSGIPEDAESDDPDEEEQREPVFSLFLSDKNDLISSFYASKSMQSAIELQNAQLPWTKHLLSSQAIRQLHTHIFKAPKGESDFNCLARLAIGLSLITGRSLDELATPVIAESCVLPTAQAPVVVDKRQGTLLLFGGRPNLSEKHLDTPFCHPAKTYITLNLPRSWYPLIMSLTVGQNRSRKSVVQSSKALLDVLPKSLHITAKNIRNTFNQKLLQVTHGDLGVQKVISDGFEANTQNIIHYAFYAVEEVEQYWHLAVEQLLCEQLPRQYSGNAEPSFVGTPHNFDIEQLRNAFDKLRQAVVQADSKGDVLEAFHCLSLYMALRLGLATAGRSTRTPLPRIYVKNGWALVTDKSRKDGSTDRLLPLTPSMLQQIAIYIDVARMLATQLPELEPLQEDERGVYLQLACLNEENTFAAFQPKFLRDSKWLDGLPANWGRKVVRSVSPNLRGRYKDIGLGHWVRGRHPWDATSTLNVDGFSQAWLATQKNLEEKLGFKQIKLNKLQLSRQRISRGYPNKLKKPSPHTCSIAEYSKEDVGLRFQSSAPNHLKALEAPDTKEKPGIALEMVRLTLRRHSSELPMERLAGLAEIACLYVRENYGIPLFASKPRPMFSSQHVLDFTDFQALAYFEEHYEKAFLKDLEFLPAVHWEQRPSNDVVNQELGRLLMVAVWRLGLNRWALIDEWLKCLWREQPILATDDVRYMSFRVKAENRRDTMRRTVPLDDFTVAYLTSEREALKKHVLAALYGKDYQTAGRRRRRADTALNAYLRTLNSSQRLLTLSHIMGASTQRIMLSASPILAAYSRGAFLTEDLDDDVLRRLHQLKPARKDFQQAKAPRFKETLVGDADVPSDVIGASKFLSTLRQIESNSKAVWLAEFKKIQAHSSLELLIHAFAIWLVEQAMRKEGDFSGREKNTLFNRLAVVAHTLLGEYGKTNNSPLIDEELLQEWFEVGRVHFRERVNQGAWFQFYHFLKQYPLSNIGWRIGDIGQEPQQQVSARVFSQVEMKEIRRRVLSSESGIGNPGYRKVASRLLDLVMTYGVRRGEAVALRRLDHQQNLLRIQPYEKHQLKTASADRVLPLSLASSDIQQWLNDATHVDKRYLLALDSTEQVGAENFFHPLNMMLKEACQDDSVGLHHFRHTVASRWMVALLKDSAGMRYLTADWPWLADWLIDDVYINNLLNNEVDGGQGLRVLSAMLGHLHPTTTLRHYIHSLCVCLFGALNKIDKLSITRSFERRVASRATIKRWATEAREGAAHIRNKKLQLQAENRTIRNHIERRYKQQGISVDERRLELFQSVSQDVSITETHGNNSWLTFQLIENIDLSLRSGTPLVETFLLEKVTRGLGRLAEIPSGKRGSSVMRHPLEPTPSGALLPRQLAAGTAQKAARNLCFWLGILEQKEPETLFWLMQKWVHASDRERGRMLLSGKDEEEKAKALDGRGLVELPLERLGEAKRMRIKCLDEKGKLIRRDTLAVRWVMSYVAAFYIEKALDA